MAATLSLLRTMLIIPAVTAFTHAPYTKLSKIQITFYNKYPLGNCLHDRKVCLRSKSLHINPISSASESNSNVDCGKQSTMDNLAKTTSSVLNHKVLINVVTEKTEMSVAKKLLQVINWAYRGKPGVPGWTG
jgi:hypothetical protein